MSAPLFSGIACKGSAQHHWRSEWLGEHPYLAHPVGVGKSASIRSSHGMDYFPTPDIIPHPGTIDPHD